MLAPRARGPWFDPRCKLYKIFRKDTMQINLFIQWYFCFQGSDLKLKLIHPGMSGLVQECVGLALDGTNPGLFQIRFQYILAHQSKNVLKSDLKKTRSFPIWGQNLKTLDFVAIL